MIICPNCDYEFETDDEFSWRELQQREKIKFLTEFVELIHDYWFRNEPKDWYYTFKQWFYKNFPEIDRNGLIYVHSYVWY